MWLLVMLSGLMCVIGGCLLLLTWGELGAVALVGVPIMAGGGALSFFGWRMRGDVRFQLNRRAFSLFSPQSAAELASRFRLILERGSAGPGPISFSKAHPHTVSEHAVCFWACVQLIGMTMSLKCSCQFRPAKDGGTAVEVLLQPSPWHFPMWLMVVPLALGYHWLTDQWKVLSLGEAFGTGALALMVGWLIAWIALACCRGLVRSMLEGILSSPESEDA